MSLADQLSLDLLQKRKIYLRKKKEIKGQKHEHRDNEVDAKFSYVNHQTHCTEDRCSDYYKCINK